MLTRMRGGPVLRKSGRRVPVFVEQRAMRKPLAAPDDLDALFFAQDGQRSERDDLLVRCPRSVSVSRLDAEPQADREPAETNPGRTYWVPSTCI